MGAAQKLNLNACRPEILGVTSEIFQKQDLQCAGELKEFKRTTFCQNYLECKNSAAGVDLKIIIL